MEYQNLFTQTQVTGPASHGVPINAYDMRERTKTIGFSHLMGRLGNAQLGPIYLGRLGVASLMFGMTAFFHYWHEYAGASELESIAVC